MSEKCRHLFNPASCPWCAMFPADGSAPVRRPPAPVNPGRDVTACVHLGRLLKREGPDGVKGCWQCWQYGCDVHGTCTRGKKFDGHACCAGCPDYLLHNAPDPDPEPPPPVPPAVTTVALPFDRILCVNLDRRPDRWARFTANCPVRGVERFPAIDGREVRRPGWWSQGAGAWGCLQSHVEILKRAVADGIGSLLVFEDDALFPPEFPARVGPFLAALPADWQQVYLGGQHRGRRVRVPEAVSGEVVRPFMVNRTHAYAVRGTFLADLLRHLTDLRAHSLAPRHHVDHRMELLHRSGRIKVYAPARWLVGQAGGPSDISSRTVPDRFWNGHADPAARRQPPVWVVGLHRSGSSVTAGILHRLGVHMGNKLTGYENRGGTGGYESHGLAQLCEAAYPFPAVEPAAPAEQTRRHLWQWLRARVAEAAHRGTVAGGKYPHLCFLIPLVLELSPASRFIHIDRPIEESIESLAARSAAARGRLRATPEQCGRLQRALDAAKREGLARAPSVLTVRYHDLIADPAREVSRIVEYLGLGVTEEQRRAAAALVEAGRRHYHAAAVCA